VKWKQIALVFTTLSLFVVPRAWNQSGNAEQQIKGVSDQISVAMLKADTDSLEKLLADDYTAIRTGGVFFNKAQEIEYVKSGALKYETNDVQDLKVRIYGRTAVTTMLVSYKGTLDGKPSSGTNRATRVWVKQNGNWKCVSYQTTRMPSANSKP
jgi:hypothetical protein